MAYGNRRINAPHLLVPHATQERATLDASDHHNRHISSSKLMLVPQWAKERTATVVWVPPSACCITVIGNIRVPSVGITGVPPNGTIRRPNQHTYHDDTPIDTITAH